jgi:GTPase
MSKKIPEPTAIPIERAFLVGVQIYDNSQLLSLEDSLLELEQLAGTAGLITVGYTTQKLSKPNQETYIGSGKVEEIKALIEELFVDVVVFDNELNPRNLRELEKIFGPKTRVVDRTALILDIFAQHANTREGILQVELAQYEYRLPRLTRAWTHLARQAGGGAGRTGSIGGVGLRGPGETQLEVDRREIQNRISHLKKELEKVRAHRSRYRAQRRRSNIPTVALVGYTNAGKSTLLNRLSNSDIYVADKLFATLDPTTRQIHFPSGQKALLTDTVGFIQKLPTQLIAAFRATLEEISEANLLIHVVDISHPNAFAHWKSVEQTLTEIGAVEIPTISALNKIDTLPDPEIVKEITQDYINSVAISALSGNGLDNLLEMVQANLLTNFQNVCLEIPYTQGRLISILHEKGDIESIIHQKNSIQVTANIPRSLIKQFEPYMKLTKTEEYQSLDD